MKEFQSATKRCRTFTGIFIECFCLSPKNVNYCLPGLTLFWIMLTVRFKNKSKHIAEI